MLGHALARVARRRARTLLVAGGIAAAAAMVSAGLTVAWSAGTGFDRAAERADLADVSARFDAQPLARVRDRLLALPNVRAASYRLEVGRVPVQTRGRWTGDAKLEGVLSGPRGYAVVAGRDIRGPGDAVVERGLARAWRLEPGDTVSVGYGAAVLRVVGVAVEPDTVAYPLARAPRVYVPYETARAVAGLGGRPVNAAFLWTADPARLDVTLAQARAATWGVGDLDVTTRAGVRLLVGRAAGIVIALLAAFSLVALAAAGTMLAASARGEVQRRLEAIGLERALGASRRRIALAHALDAALVATPAAAVGLAVGWAVVARPTARLLEALNQLPPGLDLAALLGAALVAIVGLVAAASAWPAWRAAGRRPVDLLRGGDVAGVPARTPLPAGPLGLGMRLALARPLRTAASVLVLATSAAVVLLVLAIASLLARLESDPALVGKRYALTVAGATSGDVERIRALPGVRDAAVRYETYAADSFRLGESFQVVAFAGDHTRFEAPPLAEGRRLARRGEVEVGVGLARALNLRPGAVLAAQLPSGRELRARVTGVVEALENEGRMAYMHADDVRSGAPFASTSVAVRLEPGTSRAAVERALARAGFASEDAGGVAGGAVEGWASRNSGFVDVLVALLRAVAVLDGLVCVYALAQVLALTAHERRQAVALVRAVGGSRRQVAAVFAGCALVVALLAAPVGIVVERLVLGPAVAELAAGYVELSLVAGLAPVTLVAAGLVLAALAASASATRGAVARPIVTSLREE